MSKDIRYLKGIGEQRAKLFNQLGIYTVDDLLYYFPRGYEDRSEFRKVEDVMDGETVCLKLTVFSPVREIHTTKRIRVYSMIANDDTSSINVAWYNNKYVKGQFMPGEKYVFYGRITVRNGKKEMINPLYEKEGTDKYTGKIVPIYPLTGKLTQKIVQSAMENALEEKGRIEEYMPEEIRKRYHIAQINFSVKNIHFPKDFDSYSIARERFVFEELLLLRLALAGRKNTAKSLTGSVMKHTHDLCMEFINTLPFSLTGAQERTIGEICSDMESDIAMNRLVQGDVGSGKTAVAAAVIYAAVKNGMQAVMMAPTEILAKQHYETMCGFFEGMGINVVSLTGGMKAKEKRQALSMIETGAAQVITGTHALIQEGVEYYNLGLVVADEQHRFGVEQRARLCAKGNNPHMLIMSATPIPRTLALILYGDLDISVIDELPPGRKAVKTYAMGENMRKRVYAFAEKNLRDGMQIYVVCPLVSETETSDLQNAEELSKKLIDIFPDFKVGIIHGKMKASLKEEVMNSFASGDIQILVSTTVIEVGVNVPNANMMIIENAERFGLSQLHQLRGRVGRGKNQAYCILFAHGNSDITKQRMETMCTSNDGFYISEQDLKLRGPGDFFGTRQHGLPEMKIANLFEDTDILKKAQDAAQYIMEKDPEMQSMEYAPLKERADNILKDNVVMN